MAIFWWKWIFIEKKALKEISKQIIYLFIFKLEKKKKEEETGHFPKYW